MLRTKEAAEARRPSLLLLDCETHTTNMESYNPGFINGTTHTFRSPPWEYEVLVKGVFWKMTFIQSSFYWCIQKVHKWEACSLMNCDEQSSPTRLVPWSLVFSQYPPNSVSWVSFQPLSWLLMFNVIYTESLFVLFLLTKVSIFVTYLKRLSTTHDQIKDQVSYKSCLSTGLWNCSICRQPPNFTMWINTIWFIERITVSNKALNWSSHLLVCDLSPLL